MKTLFTLALLASLAGTSLAQYQRGGQAYGHGASRGGSGQRAPSTVQGTSMRIAPSGGRLQSSGLQAGRSQSFSRSPGAGTWRGQGQISGQRPALNYGRNPGGTQWSGSPYVNGGNRY